MRRGRWFTRQALFPTLRKELVERASRRRTHVIRTVYGFFFFGGFLWAYVRLQERQPGLAGLKVIPGLSVIGQGDDLFRDALNIQWLGLMLFLPAMMCGVISEEKERGSLPLLLLTDIRAPEAILEKYLSGLVPMLTLLLFMLPVGGFAYLIGGLSMTVVLSGTFALLLGASVIGAVAVLCSSYARTTVGAFMGTYALMLLLWLWLVFGLPLLVQEEAGLGSLAGWALGIVLSCLLLACRFYHSRAEVTARSFIKRLFLWLDGKFKLLNQRLGGIEIMREKTSLPANAPVYWRELHRRQFGNLRYLIRFIVGALALVMLLIVSGIGLIPAARAVFWGLALVVWVAVASSVIVAERKAQTLEVLLTTPLTSGQILRDKLLALWPFLVVFFVPLMALVLFPALIDSVVFSVPARGILRVCAWEGGMFVLVSLWSLALGLWAGLGARSRLAAMGRGLALLVGWNVLAWGLQIVLAGTALEPWVHSIAPWQLVQANRLDRPWDPWGLAFHLGMTVVLLCWIWRRADRILGRPEGAAAVVRWGNA